jgi:hypothetical protein
MTTNSALYMRFVASSAVSALCSGSSRDAINIMNSMPTTAAGQADLCRLKHGNGLHVLDLAGIDGIGHQAGDDEVGRGADERGPPPKMDVKLTNM